MWTKWKQERPQINNLPSQLKEPEKEGQGTCNNTDGPWGRYVKQGSRVKKKLTVRITTKVLRVFEIIKPDRITAAGWKENGEVLSKGREVSVWEYAKSHGDGGGEGGTIVWMPSMPSNCTLINGKFYVYVDFTTFWKSNNIFT